MCFCGDLAVRSVCPLTITSPSFLTSPLLLPPFELTALDMLTRLSSIETGHSRQLLQEVIQQERDLTFLIELGDAYYELKVTALLVKDEAELADSSSQPFSVQGILFELKMMQGAKEKELNHARLIKHLFHLIQNDLESIYMATSLLEHATKGLFSKV